MNKDIRWIFINFPYLCHILWIICSIMPIFFTFMHPSHCVLMVREGCIGRSTQININRKYRSASQLLDWPFMNVTIILFNVYQRLHLKKGKRNSVQRKECLHGKCTQMQRYTQATPTILRAYLNMRYYSERLNAIYLCGLRANRGCVNCCEIAPPVR